MVEYEIYLTELLYIRIYIIYLELPTRSFYYYHSRTFLFELPTRYTLSSETTIAWSLLDEIFTFLIFTLPMAWSLLDGFVTLSASTVYRHDILYSAVDFPLDTVYTYNIIINEH